jgi:hypothetical protein
LGECDSFVFLGNAEGGRTLAAEFFAEVGIARERLISISQSPASRRQWSLEELENSLHKKEEILRELERVIHEKTRLLEEWQRKLQDGVERRSVQEQSSS